MKRGEPWDQLSVEQDGQQRWPRRIPSHCPSDGLDYHCRVQLEPDRTLRIRAMASVGASSAQPLCVEAREELQPTRLAGAVRRSPGSVVHRLKSYSIVMGAWSLNFSPL